MRRPLRREDRIIIGVLVVSLLYLLIVQGYPFIWATVVSMKNQQIGTAGKFVGFQNYLNLFHDPTFWSAIGFTAVYVFAAIIFKLLFGYMMAALLNQPIVGRGFFRALLFLPWALPTLTSVLTWRWMLGDIGGVVNYVLQQLHIISRPVGWLAQPVLAQISVVLVNIWRGTPFFGISILAALQSISPELYEVAKIDGANWRQRLLKITLPSISNVIILVTLISTIWTLGDFAIIWLMTRGGPANSTQVFSTLSYIVTFQNLDLSRGISIALAIVPISVLLMFVSIKLLFGKREETR